MHTLETTFSLFCFLLPSSSSQMTAAHYAAVKGGSEALKVSIEYIYIYIYILYIYQCLILFVSVISVPDPAC